MIGATILGSVAAAAWAALFTLPAPDLAWLWIGAAVATVVMIVTNSNNTPSPISSRRARCLTI